MSTANTPIVTRPELARTSAWAILAAIVLLVLGGALVLFGSMFVERGLAKELDSGGVREALIALGAVMVVTGILHLFAGALTLAHRDRGRSLGMSIAAIGTLLGAVVFTVALRGILDPGPGAGPPTFIGLLYPLPHLVVLIGLILGRRQFS